MGSHQLLTGYNREKKEKHGRIWHHAGEPRIGFLYFTQGGGDGDDLDDADNGDIGDDGDRHSLVEPGTCQKSLFDTMLTICEQHLTKADLIPAGKMKTHWLSYDGR